MKAIANSIEPKGVEPGLLPRAVRPVTGFGFEQLFTVTDTSITDEAAGIDAELPSDVRVDGQVPPTAGLGLTLPQGAGMVLVQPGIAQTMPEAAFLAQENSDNPGTAEPAPWLAGGEPQADVGGTDPGLIMPWLPDPLSQMRQVEAEGMALGAVADVNGQTAIGHWLTGLQGGDTILAQPGAAVPMPIAAASAQQSSEPSGMAAPALWQSPLELQAVLDGRGDGLTAPSAPDLLSEKRQVDADGLVLGGATDAASLGGRGAAEAVILAIPDAEAAHIAPNPALSAATALLDEGAGEDARAAAPQLEHPRAGGIGDPALTERAKTALLLHDDKTVPEPLSKPPLTVFAGPLEKGEKRINLDLGPPATAALASNSAGTIMSVGMMQQARKNARDAEPAAQAHSKSAIETAMLADLHRVEPAQVATERAEPLSITSAATRLSVLAPPSSPGLSMALPAATVLNMREADWGRQLIGQIERMVATGSQRIELSLRPKNLGQIQVSLDLRGDQTHVHIVTETAAAARLLGGAEDRLMQVLDQSGYRLSGFSAQEQGTGAQGGHAGQQGQPSPRRGRTGPDDQKREEFSEANIPSPYSADRSRSNGINMLA